MMSEREQSKNAFYLIVALSFVVFFAHTRDFKLLMDGLTYAALSKNILKTGDWKVLHYSVDQYPNFYQHPPLAMWLQALIYKVLGFSEPISRILPSLCALGSVIGVFLYANAKRGLSTAFFGALVLITSTRFVKWGTNFYLDGIFGFFCFTGFIFWMLRDRNEKKGNWFPLLSGFFFAAAAMTKGVIVAGPLFVAVISAFFPFSKKSLKEFLLLISGFTAPLLFWIFAFGGSEYLAHYLRDSVLGRVGTGEHNYSAWSNLAIRWLPWSPFFVLSLRKLDREKLWFYLAALSFPIGFSLSPVFLEHYLTPFFPFAAVVVGSELARFVPTLTPKIYRWFAGLFILTTIFLATLSPNVNEMKETPVHRWIDVLNRLPVDQRRAIKTVFFTTSTADLWYGIANILGKTDWEASGSAPILMGARAQSIFITRFDEKPDSAWQIANCLVVEGFTFYHSPDLKVCSH